MTESTITRERPTPMPGGPKRARRGQIIATILATFGLIAVLVAGSVMMFGGEDPAPTTGPTVVLGDRDAAFKAAAERYQRYLQQQAQVAGEKQVQQPPATDKEEGLKQGAERIRRQEAGR